MYQPKIRNNPHIHEQEYRYAERLTQGNTAQERQRINQSWGVNMDVHQNLNVEWKEQAAGERKQDEIKICKTLYFSNAIQQVSYKTKSKE